MGSFIANYLSIFVYNSFNEYSYRFFLFTLQAINKDDEAQNASLATTASPPTRTGNEAVPVEDQLKVSSHDKRETNGHNNDHPGPPQLETAFDGVLDPSSNYTGFVEVVGRSKLE